MNAATRGSLAPRLGCSLGVLAPRRALARRRGYPPKGEGALGLTFGDYSFDGHFDGHGRSATPTAERGPFSLRPKSSTGSRTGSP